MKCFFEEKDFRPAWHAIQSVHTGDPLDNWDTPDWHTVMLRVEADQGTLTLTGPYGQASLPARIERRGVLFVRIREFVETLEHTYGETLLELDATPEYLDTQYQRFLSRPWQRAIFDDPATAPQTWEPVEPPDDSDDQNWD